MNISSSFDGGNIEVVEAAKSGDIQLRIRQDNRADFRQWFYYRLTGAKGQTCRMRILNAGNCTYATGWESYQAVASYDREYWFRVQTSYADGILVIDHTPEFDAVYYAYFAPYSMQRHRDFVARCCRSDHVSLVVPGSTPDGDDIDILVIGEPDAAHAKKCWVVARQHPGETMGSWFVEGLVKRLLDTEDKVTRTLLSKAVFYVVPNMNPDGSRRGNLRTNACGKDLNRQWDGPTLEQSPEVFHVLNVMTERGVDFALDVHGIEDFPYCFILRHDTCQYYGQDHVNLIEDYKACLQRVNPDFQTRHTHPNDDPRQASIKGCSTNLAHRFGAVSMTFEQPFYDVKNSPQPVTGWSPERAMKMGHSNLEALCHIL